MKKYIHTAGVILMLVSEIFAGSWVIDVNANLTTALNTYSDSWEGGEAGSFTWGSQFLGTAERQLSAKFNTKATLNLQFGQTKVQDEATGRWAAPQKSVDLIDALEMLKFTLGAWVDPFVSVRAISQFLDGSDTLIRYVNPLDLTESAGVSRTLKKNDNVEWSTRIGAAARQLVDRQKYDAVSGNRATDVTNDGGIEFNMDLKAINAAKWANFISSLKIYEALLSSKADEFKAEGRENVWRHPHVRWENTLTLTFAKYLMLGLTAYAYYDKEINTSVRLKETFSAGLTYIYTRK
ncbi:MAG: hypothetical protein JW699_01650 [Chitinispirillaceae bacterium]|nr:hypothetical protein [Chitinispirillaceae bacterium]